MNKISLTTIDHFFVLRDFSKIELQYPQISENISFKKNAWETLSGNRKVQTVVLKNFTVNNLHCIVSFQFSKYESSNKNMIYLDNITLSGFDSEIPIQDFLKSQVEVKLTAVNKAAQKYSSALHTIFQIICSDSSAYLLIHKSNSIRNKQ